MSLRGIPLLVVLAVLAVAAPAAAYLAWSRVPGGRWARAGQRLGLVAVAQVCAVALTAAAANDYGQVFSSWPELWAALRTRGDLVASSLRAAETAGVFRHYGAGATPPLGAPLAAPRAPADASGAGPPLPGAGVRWTSWSARPSWPARGAVAMVDLAGRRTGLSAPAEVYLPPAYFAGDRALPVVEVFTGYPGSPPALVDRMHYPDLLLGQLARHRAVPMVLVMARPAVTYPRDTECTDVPGGEQVFTFWAQDAPDAVAARFGLRPTGYAAMGDSTGGYCAAKLAVLDPARFAAGVSLSGYFNAEQDATTGDLFGGSARYGDLQDLRWRLRHLPQPPARLFLGTSPGETGADGYRTQQDFAALVRPPMAVDEFVLRHGLGHTFGTWVREIPAALSWISHELPGGPGRGPRPAPTGNAP